MPGKEIPITAAKIKLHRCYYKHNLAVRL